VDHTKVELFAIIIEIKKVISSLAVRSFRCSLCVLIAALSCVKHSDHVIVLVRSSVDRL